MIAWAGFGLIVLVALLVVSARALEIYDLAHDAKT